MCTYCCKKFPTKLLLRDHINVHTKETPYECWVCHKRYPFAASWRKHLKKLHNITSVKRPDVVNKQFENNNTEVASNGNANVEENIDIKEVKEEIYGHNETPVQYETIIEEDKMLLHKQIFKEEMSGLDNVESMFNNNVTYGSKVPQTFTDILDRGEFSIYYL